MATTQRAQSGRTRSTSAQGGGQAKSTTERKPRTVTVHLPLVTAEVRRPDFRLPDFSNVRNRLPDLSNVRDDITDSVNDAVSTVRDYLPSGKQAAYYGGLGLLAAFSVIEWPVAAAIGVGTVIAQRSGGHQSSEASSSSSPSSSTSSSSSSSSTQSRSASARASE